MKHDTFSMSRFWDEVSVCPICSAKMEQYTFKVNFFRCPDCQVRVEKDLQNFENDRFKLEKTNSLEWLSKEEVIRLMKLRSFQ